MKRTINEAQLRDIVRESVKRVLNEISGPPSALNELDWKTYANAANKAGERCNNDYWRERGLNLGDAFRANVRSRGRVKSFGRAAQDAFDRDYGYQQGKLGDKDYQRIGMGGEFGGADEFGPHVAGWKSNECGGTTRFPYGMYCHQRTPEEFFDGNDDAVDAYNKAKEEMGNFKKGNYDYIKGKGYQLKK